MNLFSKTRLACVLTFLVAAAVRGADDQEQSFRAANCALTPPPGWHLKNLETVPGFITAYSSPDNTRLLMVCVFERGKAGPPFNDASVVEYDKGMEKGGGGPKISGKFVQFAGFPAYERRGTAKGKEKALSTLILAVPTGDGLYTLEALTAKGEAGDDEEIRRSLNSFRFLHSLAPLSRPPDAAFQAGYLLGRVFFGCAILALVVWVFVHRVVARRGSPMPAGLSGPYPYPGAFQAGFPPLPTAPPPLPASHPIEPPPPPYPPSLY